MALKLVRTAPWPIPAPQAGIQCEKKEIYAPHIGVFLESVLRVKDGEAAP
jgi:hypothetical protein